MPKIRYIWDKKLSAKSREVVEYANDIIEEYESKGYYLTLRQLYYQFVARDLIENTDRSYKRLGSIINDARLLGLVDWDSIEDRTRHVRSVETWDSPREIISSCAGQYETDRWDDQDYHVEVWIEKDALVGVVEYVCVKMQVGLLSCRGYLSQSEMWRAGQRFQEAFGKNKVPVVLHLGDHDPSGINMTQDIEKRLEMFCGGVQVKRIALTMDQVERFNPPPNPAKLSDSRSSSYVSRFGYSSWELDALDPMFMSRLVEDSVETYVDWEVWKASERKQQMERKQLIEVKYLWYEVVEFVDRFFEEREREKRSTDGVPNIFDGLETKEDGK